MFKLRLSPSISVQKKPKTYRGQEVSTKGGDNISIVEEMKNADVRTVDRDRLVDINEIEIDDSLPPKERAAGIFDYMGLKQQIFFDWEGRAAYRREDPFFIWLRSLRF